MGSTLGHQIDAQDRAPAKPSQARHPPWLTVSPEGQPSTKKCQLPLAQPWLGFSLLSDCPVGALVSSRFSIRDLSRHGLGRHLFPPRERESMILLVFCASKNSVMSQ